MKVLAQTQRTNKIPVFNDLILAHRRFQEFLDLLTAEYNQAVNIDALIEIRKFNISCISKYADLVSKPALNLIPLTQKTSFGSIQFEGSEAMWEMNSRLSQLIPVYSKALKHRALNSMSRTIISKNFDTLLEIKDNLLHPISTNNLVLE